jgi:hypothetical protein
MSSIFVMPAPFLLVVGQISDPKKDSDFGP